MAEVVVRKLNKKFDVTHVVKDVDLAIEQGEDLGVPMWVCQAARLVLKHAVFQGRAQQDLSRAIEIIEEGAQSR